LAAEAEPSRRQGRSVDRCNGLAWEAGPGRGLAERTGSDRISFHHELGRFEGKSGRLVLDDGTTVDVTVNGPYLEVRGQS
jgi:hypothetical protein